MDYSRFIGAISANRQPNLLRVIKDMQLETKPDLIKLHGGGPNPNAFPFARIDVTLQDGSQLVMDEARMRQILQVGETKGLPGLVRRLKDLQTEVHGLDAAFWQKNDILVTSGAMDALCKSCDMALTLGCSVVVDEYVFPGTLALLRAYGPRFVAIEGDKHGMRADRLREALAGWKTEEQGQPPKVIILNPTGANPTGTVMSEERRREIYKICCTYNLLIIEDDPVYFITFGPDKVTSFLSLDTEGRVLRFDSFSKIVSNGMRVGFITGPKPLMSKLTLHTQVSIVHASSVAQEMINLLLEKWGLQGFYSHITFVQDLYRQRRNAMQAAAEKHLTGLCEWNLPAGGMFFWLKVKGVEDTWHMIMNKGMEKGVVFLPGRAMQVKVDEPSPYIRVSYSLAKIELFDKALACLAKIISETREELRKETKH